MAPLKETKHVHPYPLQKAIVYGPVRSRRLGASLGINILPLSYKFCSFDCAYCQYGWTPEGVGPEEVKSAEELLAEIERAFRIHRDKGTRIDRITLSGNGEPTLHPQFEKIVHGLKCLRDRYFPDVRLGILSNAHSVENPNIRRVLKELDDCYMKLDAGTLVDLKRINRPRHLIQWPAFLEGLRALSEVTIQTMFITGSVDNTADETVDSWIEVVAYVRPRAVHIYSIDRPAADPGIHKVSRAKLEEIAKRLKTKTGIQAEVFG